MDPKRMPFQFGLASLMGLTAFVAFLFALPGIAIPVGIILLLYLDGLSNLRNRPPNTPATRN